MTAVALGLLIAVAFGTGDYVGGRASTTASTPAVLVVAQACSVVGALVVAVVVSADVAAHDVTYGALAGAVNVVGLMLLYHALAYHPASVVAPITAVTGAVVPVGWGFAQGERPSGVVVAGIVVAIVAGGLIALEPGAVTAAKLATGAPQAVAAGLALGSSLVLFAETSDESGQWPVFAARVAALTVSAAIVAALARRRPVPFPRGRARTLALTAGAFDIAATALLVVAVRRELLVIVAPIASLAPAFTVVLAWILLHERVDGPQRVGFVLALAGLVLVAAG